MQKLKFLSNSNKNLNFRLNTEELFLSNTQNLFDDYIFEKNFIKNRKLVNQTRLGIAKNIKKSSIRRNKYFNFLNLYINISHKKGKKLNFLKNFNKSAESVFTVFNESLVEFENYKNYENYIFLCNNDFRYSNFNSLIDLSLSNLESIFEIKTIKNNKKLKLPTKYTHEIIYIPKERRLKYVMRALSLYKENFKSYYL